MAKRILNEIRSEDAYKRFYSDVNIDIYNLITFGSKNLLNISKFILDYFKKQNYVFPSGVLDNIKKIGEIYEILDNQTQREINDRAKSGQYATFDELYQDVASKEEAFTPVEGLQYGNNGIIILRDDDKFRITCAPTYESETKTYGNTKWCTASDIYGRYNGYYFFINYSLRPSRFTPDDTFRKLNEFERIRYFIDNATSRKETQSLIQVLVKGEVHRLFQCQVNLATQKINTSSFGQICDEYDDEWDIDDFEMEMTDCEYGSFDNLLEIISNNAALIKQNILKHLEAEYGKQYKIYQNVLGRAKGESALMHKNISSIVDSIVGNNDLFTLGEELRAEFNDETDEYEWVDNLKYYDGEDWDVANLLTVRLGTNNKGLNGFMERENLSPYLTFSFNEDGMIGYKLSDKQPYLEISNFEGVDYIIAMYDNAILDLKFNKVRDAYITNLFEFFLISDNQFERVSYGVQSKDGKEIECYFGKNDGECFSYRKVGNILEMYYDRYRGQIIFHTKNGTITRTYQELCDMDDLSNALPKPSDYKMSSNDVATMVRECVLRIINEGRMKH